MTSASTHVDRVLARAVDDPDAELARDPRQAFTAGAFGALVAQLARALEQHGLTRGDRVALLVAPSCEALAIRYAAAVLGCVSVFCPYRDHEAFADFVDLVDPAALVVGPQRGDGARAARCPVVSLGPVEGVAHDLLAEARALPAEPLAVRARRDDVGFLVTSGGTTGAQKASRLTFATYERLVSVLGPPDYDLAHPERLSSSGRPLPGVEVRIERPDGAAAATGEVGQIVVRSPGAAAGYVRPPAVSGFTEEGFRTGDLGRLDADGYLHVLGRAADARTIDGRTVMPLDVEDALCAHPDVRYAVAFPAPGEDGRFAAAVVLAPGAEVGVDTLARQVHHRAAIVVVDRIPATEQGKPDRAALAARIGPAT